MSQPIHQMFSSDESAAAAANALLEYGFLEVHVCPPAGGGLPAGRSAPLDEIVAELMRQFVLKWRAKALAPRIQAGAAVVTVHAPFGSAGAALGILAGFHPIDNGLPDTSTPALRWDDAAPMSSALQMPVLLQGLRRSPPSGACRRC